MTQCSKCHRNFEENWIYCPTCGSQIPKAEGGEIAFNIASQVKSSMKAPFHLRYGFSYPISSKEELKSVPSFNPKEDGKHPNCNFFVVSYKLLDITELEIVRNEYKILLQTMQQIEKDGSLGPNLGPKKIRITQLE
ncbi:MAG: hypothetical protein HY602_02105 [Parcubacteria group bacterium]|nr:hypothetical protein [Parcubacteria group bacterium]